MKLSLRSLLPFADRGWKSMVSECALPACRNTLLWRSAQSRAGINVGQLWYCSLDCFAEAARDRFATRSVKAVLEMPHSPRLSIGLVMLSKGYLTDDQLRFATAQSQLRGIDLASALHHFGLATERQITAARAAQWGYPMLGQDRVVQAVEADVPLALLRRYSAVPLQISALAKRFVLGFVYRVEHSVLNSLEQITGFRTDPCFITPTEHAEQLERLTLVPHREEQVFEDAKTPTQMGKTVAGFALEIGAREARFANCQDYAWTRLLGKRRTIDVLFRMKDSSETQKPQIPYFQRRASAL
jgi:hypothetical protein